MSTGNGGHDRRTSVYVAEDHPVFREAVAQAIATRPTLALAGTAADGPTALAGIRELAPAVAILDEGLPGLGGADIAKEIRREGLTTRVVTIADGASPLVYDAIRLGCAAYLTKAATLAEICATVEAVARGETVIAAEVQTGFVTELRRQTGAQRPVLSARELAVLRLVADGRSGPHIAKALSISVSTVRTHVKRVMVKLGVRGRAAAVAEAMRRGLIS